MQTQANHMNLKSVRKFWQFTVLFLLGLMVFNDLLFKLYEGIRKVLMLNDFGLFVILTVLFSFLFWDLVSKAKDNKQVTWRLRDAFITSVVIYSVCLFVKTFISLSLIPLSYFSFVDYSLYQWITSNFFKNIHLLLFITFSSSTYLAVKYYYWDSKAELINSLQKSKKKNFELNDDRTLGETEVFQNCKTPEELKDLDKLGRFDYAQQISHIIINNGEQKSFAIGINGDWGSGKTSFIQMVRSINEIEYKRQCLFVNFNPWYFTGTEKVLKKFYDTLINVVGNNFSINFRNDLTKYFELICATETKIWKTNFLQYFKQNVDFDSQLEELKEHFKGLQQKIVIVIDDLDRLQKDEILVLFRTIRLIADFPNVVYLVGYSPSYLDHVLEEKENEDEPRFMEKIFQLEFELPEPMPSDLRIFWKSVIEKHIPSDILSLQTDIIDNIVNNSIIPNLRDIKRFLNQLTINSSLPEIKNNTYFPQFFLLELIYYCDINEYFRIREKGSFDASEKIKPATKTIIDQIVGLKTHSEKSITKKEHFKKYFFKRLDRDKDIDSDAVIRCFTDKDFGTQLEDLFTKNKRQLVGHILDYTTLNTINKETINKDFAIAYFDRVFHLLEYNFTQNKLHKDYFLNRHKLSDVRIFTGIARVWKLFAYSNEEDLKKYIINKESLNCYSFLLTALSQEVEIREGCFDFNSLFIKRIESTCNIYDDHIEATLLLIDLFNYQLFLKSNTRIKNKLYWLENKKIANEIQTNSEKIDKKIIEFKEENKDISILSFFGSNEALLKLNDLNNRGIFNMLDMQEYSYPIHKEQKVTEFLHPFKYSHYNYELNIPNTVESIKIINEINEVEYEILKVGHNFIIKTEIEHNLSEKLNLMDNPVIQFINEGNGLYFTLRERANRKNGIDSGDYPLYKTNITNYKVHCYSKNKVDFIMKREIVYNRGVKEVHRIPFSRS